MSNNSDNNSNIIFGDTDISLPIPPKAILPVSSLDTLSRLPCIQDVLVDHKRYIRNDGLRPYYQGTLTTKVRFPRLTRILKLPDSSVPVSLPTPLTVGHKYVPSTASTLVSIPLESNEYDTQASDAIDTSDTSSTYSEDTINSLDTTTDINSLDSVKSFDTNTTQSQLNDFKHVAPTMHLATILSPVYGDMMKSLNLTPTVKQKTGKYPKDPLLTSKHAIRTARMSALTYTSRYRKGMNMLSLFKDSLGLDNDKMNHILTSGLVYRDRVMNKSILNTKRVNERIKDTMLAEQEENLVKEFDSMYMEWRHRVSSENFVRPLESTFSPFKTGEFAHTRYVRQPDGTIISYSQTKQAGMSSSFNGKIAPLKQPINSRTRVRRRDTQDAVLPRKDNRLRPTWYRQSGRVLSCKNINGSSSLPSIMNKDEFAFAITMSTREKVAQQRRMAKERAKANKYLKNNKSFKRRKTQRTGYLVSRANGVVAYIPLNQRDILPGQQYLVRKGRAMTPVRTWKAGTQLWVAWTIMPTHRQFTEVEQRSRMYGLRTPLASRKMIPARNKYKQRQAMGGLYNDIHDTFSPKRLRDHDPVDNRLMESRAPIKTYGVISKLDQTALVHAVKARHIRSFYNENEATIGDYYRHERYGEMFDYSLKGKSFAAIHSLKSKHSKKSYHFEMTKDYYPYIKYPTDKEEVKPDLYAMMMDSRRASRTKRAKAIPTHCYTMGTVTHIGLPMSVWAPENRHTLIEFLEWLSETDNEAWKLFGCFLAEQIELELHTRDENTTGLVMEIEEVTADEEVTDVN